MDHEKNSALLKALGHPLRLQMAEGLLNNECNVNKITDILGVSQSTVSQHLAILKNCGIVTARREGTKVCYRVTDERVRAIIKLLGR